MTPESGSGASSFDETLCFLRNLSREVEPRVAVTGLGVASPIGSGLGVFYEGLLAGRLGTGELTRLDTAAYPTHRGGEVRDLRDDAWGAAAAAGPCSRSTALSLAVTSMALDDASVTATAVDPKRIGVCFGVVLGSRPHIESSLSNYAAGTGPLLPSGHNVAEASQAPARAFALHGPNLTVATACAAGNSAISHAASIIRANRADAMIAGGADQISEAMFALFSALQSLAPDVVRPFDKHRQGIMLSEGAAALLLESEPHARARGARIYGYVRGDGNFADAYHMTSPHPRGLGAIRAMTEALRRSGLAPEEIDYISAHGTGTLANDAVESEAIRAVFGSATDRVPVSSIKSMLGHTQGAASAIESVACLLAIHHGFLPPNINFTEADPACALNLVVNKSRSHRVRFALNNAFGFGGNISCIVFGAE